ncbi:hypothetical protein M3Y99_01689900 [Aphelenchoides fujianensis]|nr:hypothetical protein M3Y99_01689900 [Aphelenchoides fujianensis]
MPAHFEMNVLSQTTDHRHENRRLLIFAIVLIANLLIIGCLLVVWNVKAINDDHSTWAILFVGATSGLFILCGLLFMLLCLAGGKDPKTVGIQTVYPTPEFHYLSSTMLNRVQQKLAGGNDSMQRFQGSAFSVLSTLPADMSSNSTTATVSPPMERGNHFELKETHAERLRACGVTACTIITFLQRLLFFSIRLLK